MELNPKTKSRTDAPEQLREMAEKGAAQSKEVFERMSAAFGQAADVMQHCLNASFTQPSCGGVMLNADENGNQ